MHFGGWQVDLFVQDALWTELHKAAVCAF